MSKSSIIVLVRDLWGIPIRAQHKRFFGDSWDHQGESSVRCPNCEDGTHLEVFRRSVTTNRGEFRDWCLVCTHCRTAKTLDSYSSGIKQALQEWDRGTPRTVLPGEGPRHEPPPSTRKVDVAEFRIVLEASKAELKSLEGKISITEVGLALRDDDSKNTFKILGPSRDLSELPSAELFLAPEKNSQQRFKISQVIYANKIEIKVRVEYSDHYPSRMSLFAQSDPTVVIKGLIAFLEKMENPRLARTILKGGPLDPGESIGWPGLNIDQNLALGAMTSSGVSLVWGPPGTGKTRVIGAAVTNLMKQGKSVALVSNTNVAVDQALLQVCEDAEDFKPGTVLRIGNPSLSGVTDHPYLMADNAARILGEDLSREMKQLESELETIRGHHENENSQALAEFLNAFASKTVKTAVRHQAGLKELETTVRNIKREEEKLQELVKEESETAKHHEDSQSKLLSMKEHEKASAIDVEITELKLAHSQNSEFLRQVAERMNSASTLSILKRRRALKELSVERETLEKTLLDQVQMLTKLEISLSEFEKKGISLDDLTNAKLEANAAGVRRQAARALCDSSRELIKDLRRLLRKTESLPPLSEEQKSIIEFIDGAGGFEAFKSRVQLLESSERKKRKLEASRVVRIEEIQKELTGLSEKLIANAPVIGTTLAQLFVHRALIPRSFDHVIIDEVSTAQPILVFGAMAKANASVTLVGDFEQNGPISNIFKLRPEPSDEIRSWLETHSFEKFGIDSASGAELNQGCRILTEQYRFGEKTMELANNLAYGGLLTNGRELEKTDAPEITIIDTSTLGEASKKETGYGGKGKWWSVGVAAASAIAKKHGDVEVGIVTPYRDQMMMTKAWLVDQGVANTLVGTAHAFQGQEFPVVLVDLVEDGDGTSWVARGDRTGGKWNRDGFRLFNVALTRNAGRLYILCNVGSINSSRKGPLFELGKMLRDGKIDVVDVQEIVGGQALGFDFAPEKNEARQDKTLNLSLEDAAILKDESFYNSFEQDLASAKSDVIIYSPFVAPNRLRSLLPLLKTQRDRGIAIKIFTKADTELDFSNLLDNLKDAGMDVHQRRGMHEKVVVIDKRIMYSGSLNVLSNNGSTGEIMLRFDGADFARQMLRSMEK